VAAPAADPAPVVPAADTGGDSPDSRPPASVAERDPGGQGMPAAEQAAIGSLVLAGVGVTLDRLRRVQQRKRGRGRRIRMPDTDLAANEAAIRAAGDRARLVEVADLQRALLGIDGIGDGVAISHIRSGSRGARAVLTGLEAPSPDGEGWRPAQTGDDHAGRVALPTLVALGSHDGEDVLVDLESCGVVAVGGVPDRAADVVRSVALSIATADWADDVELVLVDVDIDLSELPWVERVDSIDEALGRVEARQAEAEESMAFAGVPSSLAGRAAGAVPEAWEPLVVVSMGAVDESQRARLADLAARPGRCTAVVVAGDVPSIEWQLTVGPDGELAVPALGLSISAHLVGAQLGGDVAELLSIAADVEGVEPERADSEADVSTCSADGAAPVVVVRVLGDVDVLRDGEAVAFDRAKSLEAVAYLALHPSGVTKDSLQQALWPEGDNAEGTWHQTISKARRAMGDAPDGTPYFPPVVTTGGSYRLSPAVGSDHAQLVALADAAAIADDEAAERLLREGLSLVRGEPIAGRGVAYAWRPGPAATVEADVVDAAERLAELCLGRGDGKGAEWAARQGLLASPYDERLYRLLMRAADAEGNPAGVRRVLHELTAKLELDVEPLDSLHPETVELYERLTDRRGRAASA